jgi:hypothetical protein
MKNWIQSVLENVVLFFETLTFRNEFLSPRKKGFLIEIKEDGETSYLIRNAQGAHVLYEIDRHHDYIVQCMKQAGVPIIPFQAMDDVYAGREKIEVLYQKYSRRKYK